MNTPYLVSFDVDATEKETAEEFSGRFFEAYGELVAALPDNAEIWSLPNFCVSANNEEISLTSIYLANVYVKAI